MLQPCLQCGQLTPAGSYCPEHKPTSTRDYRGWDSTARAAKVRDGYRCRRCGGDDRLQAHHIVWAADGGPNTLSNAISLCGDCHRDAPRDPEEFFSWLSGTDVRQNSGS